MTKLMQDTGIAIETHHMFWTNNFFMENAESPKNMRKMRSAYTIPTPITR
jgi:hypothetical protein